MQGGWLPGNQAGCVTCLLRCLQCLHALMQAADSHMRKCLFTNCCDACNACCVLLTLVARSLVKLDLCCLIMLCLAYTDTH